MRYFRQSRRNGDNTFDNTQYHPQDVLDINYEGKSSLESFFPLNVMIRVDIGGHPPHPLSHDNSPSWQFFYGYLGPKILGPF